VAEWFKAPVLKTGRGLCSLVSSNLTPSASQAEFTGKFPAFCIVPTTLNPYTQIISGDRLPATLVDMPEMVGWCAKSCRARRPARRLDFF
jgi:hypothetical protein